MTFSTKWHNFISNRKRTKSRQGYPNLLIHHKDKEMIIELEKTRKSRERFESELDRYYRNLQDGKEILWLVPNENIKKFVDKQIKAYK